MPEVFNRLFGKLQNKMLLEEIKIIILDFDGVVIESNEIKTEAFRYVFGRFPDHADAMMAYHELNVSQSRFIKFDHLLMLLGCTGDEILKNELSKLFSEYVFEKMMKASLVVGAEQFLKEMTQKFPVYLASVTPDEELQKILSRRQLAHWFRAVYGCPPWTKSDAIIDILKREKSNPINALLIGDSAGDQRAAKQTGVPFLARNSGLLFDEPYPKQFNDLNEILEYLVN